MSHSETRRSFIHKIGSAALAAPILSALPFGRSASLVSEAKADGGAARSGFGAWGNGQYTPVQTPGVATLPFEWDGDVKVFRLTAEPVRTYFPDMSDPNGAGHRPILAWGYNGSVPGPTIEAVEGDRVRIIFQNRLPEPTSVHWHGLHVPNNMDGVIGISQDPVPSGGTFTYEFTLEQHGTYFYHPHYMGSKQLGMGLTGFFIVHPRTPEPWQVVDHDYAYLLQTWMIHPGTSVPDTMEMVGLNYFTLNGKAAPDVVPMKARSGEKVRIRLVNVSMMNHPIHLHGHSFKVTEYGAGFVPPTMHLIANTADISAGEARCLDFVAGKKGTWVMHCHFLHHVMNDMHRTPIPGQGGHSAHEMGGMVTWIEVT